LRFEYRDAGYHGSLLIEMDRDGHVTPSCWTWSIHPVQCMRNGAKHGNRQILIISTI
jgi:hypothetical protein